MRKIKKVTQVIRETSVCRIFSVNTPIRSKYLSAKFIIFILSMDSQINNMFKLAIESRKRAYCPYSKFAVGACLLGAN